MSFREDFFEALRSVKRDFLRDNEYKDPDPLPKAEAAGEASDIPPQEHRSQGGTPPEDRFYDILPTDGNGGDSTYDSMDDGDDTDSAAASDTYSDYDADEQPTPPVYPDFSAETPSGDGRKIYDFGADDVYSDDKTVISRNTVIRGALHTEDSLRMLGQIMGDIECKSNVVVAGKVRGNTSAANAFVMDAQVDGNMVCDDSININKNAWVLGNIRAQQAEIDGKIKGNIEIRHGVSIGPDSSIIGNISTDELEIKRGAFINGQIIMYSPSRDVIDRFDHFEG